MSSRRIDPPPSPTAQEKLAYAALRRSELKKQELELRERELQGGTPPVGDQGADRVSQPKPRHRTTADKDGCKAVMRQRFDDCETQGDLRKEIAKYFEGEADQPSKRTTQQWAKDWWNEFSTAPSTSDA